MLLEFTANNFKSFKNELVFSMEPAPKQKGLDYSILNYDIDTKKYKGLCSSVLYGPNASGKSNLISAMETFKQIILRGNIHNDENEKSPNLAAYNLELIPNSNLEKSKPVEFSIKFITDNKLYNYQLKIDLGVFLDELYKRKILKEELLINEKLVFSRDETIRFGNLNDINEYLVNEFEINETSAKSLAQNNLNNQELFLLNGFKAMFSSILVNKFIDWLEDCFITIYRFDSFHIVKKIKDPKVKTAYVNRNINKAVKIFGNQNSNVGYIMPDEKSEAILCSLFKNRALTAEAFESFGTVRFIEMIQVVLDALRLGGTLIVDEFDASIHPMAIMSIINIFHNDELNKNKAQLIFNTHNPIFLNPNLFRRDEIKFIERDDETGFSTIYSLSDFKTSGKAGVRKTDDYLKNYFVNRYGAIKDIDFSPIIESIWKDE